MLERTLTPELRAAIDRLPRDRRAMLTELRLRRGCPAMAAYPWGEELLAGASGPIPVTDKLLEALLDRATGFSPYALRTEERALYLPLEDGCRMALCGEAALRDGRLQGLRKIGSMAIRLARACPGVATETARRLTRQGVVESALIVSPPGGGKTTFLRDLVRAVSEGGWRVSVADERREIAAVREGVPMLDVGPATDVLSGCPKAQAMAHLIRVMTPQVLAVDELSGPAELQMAMETAQCGVALFATAHGPSLETVRRRPGWAELLEAGTFQWCVTLVDRGRIEMERVEDYDPDHRRLSGGGRVPGGGVGLPAGHTAEALPEAPAAAGPGADAGGDGAAYACGGGPV